MYAFVCVSANHSSGSLYNVYIVQSRTHIMNHDECSENGTIVDGIKQILYLCTASIDYEQSAINSAFCQLFSHYKTKEHGLCFDDEAFDFHEIITVQLWMCIEKC